MLYGVETTLYYRAWDTSGNAYKTGDAANHALYWNKDGSAAATTNSPAEVDASNQPGLYKITLTATEMQCLSGALGGKSSTSNVALFFSDVGPIRLPNAAPGANGGLPTVDGNNRIVGIQGTVNTFDALVTHGDGAWATATGFSTHSAADVVTALGTGSTLTALATASALATAQADLDIITGADGVILATAQANYAPAKAGDEMDLVNAPNGTAVAAIQDGLATASNLAMVAGYIDTEVAAIKSVTDKLDTALEPDGEVHRFTANALENAPAGEGGGGGFTSDDRTTLNAIKAKTDLITAGAIQVSIGSHVASNGATLVLVRGESYLDAIGNAITFVIEDSRITSDPTQDGTKAFLRLRPRRSQPTRSMVSVEGTIAAWADGAMTLRFDLPRSQTVQLPIGEDALRYEIDLLIEGQADQVLTAVAHAPVNVRPSID